MKSFKDKLSPTEMAAVAKYVRQIAMRPKPAGTGAP
jgi:mono/diheme cytochrome c family protein